MDEHLQNNIDKIFRDALSHTNHDPSSQLWENIERKLNEDDEKTIYLRNLRRTLAACSLLFIFAVLGIVTQIKFRESKSSASIANSPKVSTQNNSSKSKLIKNKIQDWNHNINNSNIAMVKKNSTPADPGKINIGFSPVEVTDLKLPIPHADQISLPESATGPNDKSIVKHQQRNFKDRISVTPYFSQEFAGYNFKDKDSTGPGGKEIEQRERNIFSASLGFYFNYTFKKRWVIQTGLSYSWSSTNIDPSICYAVNDNNGSVQFKLNTISGYGYLLPSSALQPNIGDSVMTGKAYSQLHYLTIPLVLSYNIPFKRFSLLVGGGISFNILTSATIETKTYGSGYPEKEYAVKMMGLKKTNYGILLKADLVYHISSTVGIDLIPSFKNTLSPINLQTAVSAYPYNFGIGIGLNYRFK
jgi:Outer membrane protein beta-barrel domain